MGTGSVAARRVRGGTHPDANQSRRPLFLQPLPVHAPARLRRALQGAARSSEYPRRYRRRFLRHSPATCGLAHRLYRPDRCLLPLLPAPAAVPLARVPARAPAGDGALPAGRDCELPERRRVHPHHRVQAPHRADACRHVDRARISTRRRRSLLPGAAPGERSAVQALRGARGTRERRHLSRPARAVPLLQHGTVRRRRAQGGGAPARAAAAGAARRAAHASRAGRGTRMSELELWGGIECTVNRVGERYFSQMERNGHATRASDLDRIAALGVKKLRYPVIWELTAPRGLEHADWRWADERLAAVRSLGMVPIAGLVHPGSGREHTSLVSPCFAPKLAQYARAVAERYPWLEYYTPVNEPLTTARFSSLYGLWYPHGRDPAIFRAALFNECRAIALAMREIRKVNPAAKLVQTDDLGKYYSTAQLAYYAGFANDLRWLAWDLVFGRVTREHPLWSWLTGPCRADPAELEAFAADPCPPDIVGANYYVTSERYIDERLERFPVRYHGDERHRFADIETARALSHPTGGLRSLLVEAWQRYRTPLAVTEIQLDATREDQVRWYAEMWNAARAARAAGADVRAVTAWALFGSYDWNCLVTECRGYYEPGAFDVRGGKPRATAVAHLLSAFGRGERPDHPVLAGPGWWERKGRHYCQPVTLPGAVPGVTRTTRDMRPVLITGATGTLGSAFARICERRGPAYPLLPPPELAPRRPGPRELHIVEPRSVDAALERHQPWAVVNAAGYVRVDEAESDRDRCF